MCSLITALVLFSGTFLSRLFKKNKQPTRTMRCPLRGPKEIEEL